MAKDTIDSIVCLRATICLLLLLIGSGNARLFSQEIRLNWRPIGNTSIHHQTGDPATGPLIRVWFTSNSIAVVTKAGEVWEYSDGHWKASSLEIPEEQQLRSGSLECRVDQDAFCSEDNGLTWENLTSLNGSSILGAPLSNIAVSPSNPDEIAVVGPEGVWHSLDRGTTWAGLNQGLPNLNIKKILELPAGINGMRIATEESVLEWQPGQKLGWIPVAAALPENGAVSETRHNYTYIGFADGKILAIRNGVHRTLSRPTEAPIRSFWIHPDDASFAIAVAGTQIFRTFNGGSFWDDITGSLHAGELHGIAADALSKSIYVAGDLGVFWGVFTFQTFGTITKWQNLAAPVQFRKAQDVRLNSSANQLYIALDGYGVFAARAPHRSLYPSFVNAADSSNRSAAPGSLMSIVGQPVTAARTGQFSVPVLAASENESQIQIPFEATGNVLPLQLETNREKWNLTIPLEEQSPTIFIDHDGTPMLLDGDSGVLLDAMNPVRSGTRLQILATGLGKVAPLWPSGLAAPLENPPVVESPVRIILDGQILEASRATLAPGYVGFYIVEVEIPSLVNTGTAELYLEINGQTSNHVRVYIEP